MEIMPLFWRTVLVYIIVFLTMRLMGKREIGKLSIFDLVISIIIAEIAVFIIDDLSKPVIHGLVPIATLVLIQIGTAKLSLHSQKAREMLDGSPSYLIKNGKLDRTEMKKQRYNLDDLIVQLRQNRIMNVADVEFAILETSGKLTVVEKPQEKRQEEAPPDPLDTIRYEGLPLPLIMDGKVQDQNLSQLGKTRFWLKSKLQERGVKDFKEVFFCSVDHKGVLFLDKKR
ncbi:DUF421 domain-containing protein [Paenibacillus sp. YN15]|uniref:DUF421 domain-containing protein n=1 Tax=Paenibacillus sp. YN15 TaxID=1742774 RepID=UPI000DCBCA14|nr:DUF421 domain-containing protein [Paenibacillus sp. YN15]RAU93075.1 DUF421 domain-containing protein [Paenibacillus sp. YN15]